MKSMKVVILAGGFGTRLSEYTETIPKPMVPIGGKPVLWHIMKSYASYGYKDFIIALGYKAEVIKEYFLNYRALNADFTINLNTGELASHYIDDVEWNVTLVDTGLHSMTGGRIKRLKPYIGDDPFLLTYGDGVSDVNIENLVNFHREHGKMVTVTSVRPAARFGELEIEHNRVVSFKEKPQLHEGWINGGYFVMEPAFLDLIKGDDVMLEREPLEAVVNQNQLMAFCHDGFWHCMDTKRDHELLERMWESGNRIWSRD